MNYLLKQLLKKITRAMRFYGRNFHLLELNAFITVALLAVTIIFIYGTFLAACVDLLSMNQAFIVGGSAIAFDGLFILGSCCLLEMLRCSPVNYIEGSFCGMGLRLGTEDFENGFVNADLYDIDSDDEETHASIATCGLEARVGLQSAIQDSSDEENTEPSRYPAECRTSCIDIVTRLGITLRSIPRPLSSSSDLYPDFDNTSDIESSGRSNIEQTPIPDHNTLNPEDPEDSDGKRKSSDFDHSTI